MQTSMKHTPLTLIRIFVVLVMAISICLPCVAKDNESSKAAEQEDTISTETELPLTQIKNFAEIFTRIKRFYVEPVSDEQLLEHAVNGMLNGLDPHSVYLKGEKYDDLNEDTTGRFGGPGIEVVMERGYVKVVTPVDDTPAANAGIRTGDLIVKIDGEALAGLSLRESTNRMRGEPGTSISMTILRDGEAEPIEIELIRAVIRQASVKRRRLSDSIGYIRISQFQLDTAEKFRKELAQIKSIESFAGLVLDLRNNPGGLLTAAVSISDAFIDSGVIVSTKGRIEESDQSYVASPTDLIAGKPIVVLINGGSASASEIVAGALQDSQRAILVGQETFGKGSVQSVMEITEDEAIKLTTSRYYTPSGQSIQANGIQPDIEIAQRYPSGEELDENRIKERDLPKSLKNKDTKRDNTKENKAAQQSQEIKDLLSADYQLFEAYKLMQGLILFDSRRAAKN